MLQVFMSSLDIKQVEESVDTALREIDTKSISQLIIAFPPDDNLVIIFLFFKSWNEGKKYSLRIVDLIFLKFCYKKNFFFIFDKRFSSLIYQLCVGLKCIVIRLKMKLYRI